MKKSRILLAAGVLVFIFSGCTMNGTVVFSENGEGSFSNEITLLPNFSSYLSDLLYFDIDSRDPLFEEPVVEEALALHFQESDADVIGRNSITVSGSFDNLETVFAGFESYSGADPVRWDRLSDGRKRITVMLGEDTVRKFVGLFFDPDNPMTLGIVDLVSDVGDTESFMGNLSWMLEDYLEGSSIEELLSRSVIRFFIRVPGKIISHKGGEIDGQTVLFTVNLLELAESDLPVIYQITYL